MGKVSKKVDLQEFTDLPLKVVEVPGKIFPCVVVATPHKGNVMIQLTEKNYPFLFGSVSETNVPLSEVVKEISEVVKEIMVLEYDAKKFLLEQWNKEKNYDGKNS